MYWENDALFQHVECKKHVKNLFCIYRIICYRNFICEFSLQWFSPSWFGTVWSLLSTGMNLACSVGPLAAAFLVETFSWRATVQIFGMLSIIEYLGHALTLLEFC